MIPSYTASQERLALGLMSGTSCDGISAALIRTSGSQMERKVEMLSHAVIPFEAEMRARIMSLYPPNHFTAEALCRTKVVLAHVFADAAQAVIDKAGVHPRDVQVIGAQCTTLYHDVPSAENNWRGGQIEIAEPAIIAERLGVPVVADLRPSDMAAGGHGAPLSAFVDYVFFHDSHLSRAVQNIGGIGNATIILAGSTLDDILSFDTGPGNLLIDATVSHLTGNCLQYDVDGKMAADGKVNRPLLDWLLTHPYLSLPLPKSTGRDTFGDAFFAQVVEKAAEFHAAGNDWVRTMTAYTAETIAGAYERYVYPLGKLDETVLTGGGTHNPTLVRLLAKRVAPVKVKTHEDFGLSSDAREAITWAILADETMLGNPSNVPHASGARHRAILGKISQPPPLE